MMSECIREIEAEVFEKQHEIIKLQSEALNELVLLLLQHKDVDDADFMTAKEKIDLAAQIRAEMEL